MAVTGFEFSTELSALIAEQGGRPGSLILLLHRIQQEFGFIPRKAAEGLSSATGIPLSRIYGVITFYHFFKTERPGKHRVAICIGTACYLKGGQDLLDEARSIVGVRSSEVSADGQFSVDEVRCLGCCGLAPVLTIGDEVFGKFAKDQLRKTIAKFHD